MAHRGILRAALLAACLLASACTPLIVRAKCGPDGANDYTRSWAGTPQHISCDWPNRGSRK